jgi:hypothetical protein
MITHASAWIRTSLAVLVFVCCLPVVSFAQNPDGANPKAAPAEEKKDERPAVNAGRPTITDPAGLTAPGWVEVEFGIQRDLQKTLQLFTPAVFKLTSGNNRLEYRIGSDGYSWARDGAGGHVDGLGDTYLGLHYLLTHQGPRTWDTAIRGTIKVPTASGRRGIGTGKSDYNLLLLASKDLTPALHVDANLGYTAQGRSLVGGFDNAVLASLSATIPIPHSRFAYTNEIVYQSPVAGIGSQATTMHGITYAVHPWDVWDVAINFGLTRDAPKYQVFFGRTFFLGRIF